MGPRPAADDQQHTPQQQGPSSVSSRGYRIAPAAEAGFRDAAAYDAHRPAYPAEAVRRLVVAHMRLLKKTDGSAGAGARVVEVAAGTGKLTEGLVGALEGAGGDGGGFEVVATEPHGDMRRELAAKGLRGVVVREGKAEELGQVVEEGWADGVLAGQAFHW